MELKEIESTVKCYRDINIKETLSNLEIDKGYFIAYLDGEICIGLIKDGKCVNKEIDYKYLKSIRLFDLYMEYYIWFGDKKFNMRVRDDRNGEKTEVIDVKQVIYGTKVEEYEEYSLLKEDRGIEIKVPFKGLTVDNRQNRLFLLTRNYIGYTQNDIANYTDFRCVAFMNNETIL